MYEAQQEGGSPPISLPQESPRHSREGTPERSTSHTNEQHGDEQTVEQYALKQLIVEHVNNALQTFVRGFPTAPLTPPPNNTATIENPCSGLANSGSGGTPNESRDGSSGSSMNIILLRVVNEMQMGDKIVPKERSLSGFDNSTVITKGEIVLTTFVEGVIKDTKFQVIDTDMTYNVILRRPWIHDMDVVPSMLHQVIKFPSQWGIRQIRGDQQVSKNINSVVDSRTMNEDTNKNPVEDMVNRISAKSGLRQTDVDFRPDVIQEPEENENIKTTIEELEAVVLFEQWPD
ncbi:uncharacterized protein [Nicotiana tomentosiformis]|uniref:uncharacterized protein n=1 Tax=Nicotiana tomentosiformis TaxID=4098 RepID=UPI00388C8008